MFSGNSTGGDDHRHLLGRDHTDDEVVWEQSSVQSERDTATPSEVWEQDPLSGESHELQEVSHSESRPRRSKRAMAPPEDHGEAGTELQAEFERIFSPVRPRIFQTMS
jgi:hypothetical protein